MPADTLTEPPPAATTPGGPPDEPKIVAESEKPKKPTFVELQFHVFGMAYVYETIGTLKIRVPPDTNWHTTVRGAGVPYASAEILTELADKLKPYANCQSALTESVGWEARGGSSYITGRLIWD